MRLVVGPHAVEKAVGIKLVEQFVIEAPDVFERIPRRHEQVERHRVRDAERQRVQQRLRCPDIGEHGARVVVDEYALVVEKREALVDAVLGAVVCFEVRGRESRYHPERRTELHCQRRRFNQRRLAFVCRIRQLVPAAGCHVETHVTQQVETAVEAFVRVALIEQRFDEDPPFFKQPILDVVACPFDVVAIFPRKIQLLERRIHFLEVVANPVIEGLGVTCHHSRSSGCGRPQRHAAF